MRSVLDETLLDATLCTPAWDAVLAVWTLAACSCVVAAHCVIAVHKPAYLHPVGLQVQPGIVYVQLVIVVFADCTVHLQAVMCHWMLIWSLRAGAVTTTGS